MMENKRRTTIILTIIITAAIIISAVAYVGFFMQEPTPEKKEEPEQEIDDRISPLENQGLILEILRIRHRGLLERLLTRGGSWKDTPEFYFISNMDGMEYISKDVQALGSASEILYDQWDTMFRENKVIKDVEEEQETSQITLTIVDREKRGLFGLRSQDVKKDEISVTYDFRTGSWTGDDYRGDDDGYGHYLGETFEVWFNIYQTDYDWDGIPYWTEVNVLGTDPRVDDSNNDPDNDGIPTTWEWKWGYDPHVWDDHENLDPDIDGIENIEEYQVARWFSDPFHQDIFIETDGMERGGPFDPPHTFYEESQQAMIERFSQHGICMHIDDGWPNTPHNGGGEILQHYDTVSQDSGMMLQYYRNHFPEERQGIFRYFLVGHGGAFTHPGEFHRYDTTHLSTSWNARIIAQMGAITPRLWRVTFAAQAMHELGHSLGILPWTIAGNDNLSSYARGEELDEYLDEWGNYHSVMNYYWLYRDKKMIDYSDGSHGKNDQNDWEKLYLPFFQLESQLVEDINITPPIDTDKIIDEHVGIKLDGWEYSKELTQQYTQEIAGRSPVDPIQVNYSVWRKTDDHDYSSNRTIRVYARPIIESNVPPYKDPYTTWSLIKEGYTAEEDTNLVILPSTS